MRERIHCIPRLASTEESAMIPSDPHLVMGEKSTKEKKSQISPSHIHLNNPKIIPYPLIHPKKSHFLNIKKIYENFNSLPTTREHFFDLFRCLQNKTFYNLSYSNNPFFHDL